MLVLKIYFINNYGKEIKYERRKDKISVNQEDVQNIINCYEKDIERIKHLEEVIKEAIDYMNSEEFFIKMNSNSIQPPPDKYCCQDYFEAKETLFEILSKGENNDEGI